MLGWGVGALLFLIVRTVGLALLEGPCTGRTTLALLMPLVLGLLTLVIPGSAGFTINKTPDTAGESLQILVILVIGACFMGTALTVRDLVGERDIFERERAVGLRPGAYLTAKIGVYFGVAIAQSTTMVVICVASVVQVARSRVM